MSGRKNKVLLVFALAIITLNMITLFQVNGIMNNQIENDTILPSYVEETNIGDTSPFVPNSAGSDYPNLSLWDLDINVTRAVKLHEFGYLTINDTYVINKNDNITLPIFRFAYPKSWGINLVSIKGKSMYDAEDVPLNDTEVFKEYDTEYYSFYAMNLIPALENSSDYKINVQATFLRPYSIFEWVYMEGEITNIMVNGIAFNFSQVPLISHDIAMCRTAFNTPEEGNILTEFVYPVNATVETASVIFGDLYDIPAFNFSTSHDPNDRNYKYYAQIGCFLTKSPPAEAISYKRTITLDNWYYAHIREEITMQCLGVSPDSMLWDLLKKEIWISFAMQELHLYIDNAQDVVVYDELGKLVPKQGSEIAQLNRINIFLRGPIIGGEIKSFTIDYKLKLEEVLEYEKTEYVLKTLGLPKVDFHVANFDLDIVFPQGARFQYLTFGNQPTEYITGYTGVFLNIGRRQTVSLSMVNITRYDNLQISASYTMNDLSYFIQPLIFALIIFIACLCYVGLRILRKDIIEKILITPESREEVPIELIQKFVESYEEKTALQLRISELDLKRRKKKIKAKEYDYQRKILESKMRELIKNLDTIKRNLKEKGKKYSDSIQKIEITEEKRSSIERSTQELRVRYIREKQISKDAYLKILKDYQNQIERFERDIDKEIINLRLLIEHETSES